MSLIRIRWSYRSRTYRSLSGVNLEHLAEHGEYLVAGALQVEPEQPVLFQGQLDVGASELVLQAVRKQ
jgi:hypothetical protein